MCLENTELPNFVNETVKQSSVGHTSSPKISLLLKGVFPFVKRTNKKHIWQFP